jgi:hypothetical protein
MTLKTEKLKLELCQQKVIQLEKTVEEYESKIKILEEQVQLLTFLKNLYQQYDRE